VTERRKELHSEIRDVEIRPPDYLLPQLVRVEGKGIAGVHAPVAEPLRVVADLFDGFRFERAENLGQTRETPLLCRPVTRSDIIPPRAAQSGDLATGGNLG
jgi:hypothetical protein